MSTAVCFHILFFLSENPTNRWNFSVPIFLRDTVREKAFASTITWTIASRTGRIFGSGARTKRMIGL